MKTLDLVQGSPEWLAHRSTARNASDVSALLGCSPYQTRAELLYARHTCLRPEVDAAQQRRFDDGHAIEAAQLSFAEAIIDDSLYAVVGSAIIGGIELSASFDGLTLMEDVAFECKSLNDKLRAALPNAGPDDNDAANLPKMYRLQMQQQLMVSGAGEVLFVAANKDGTDVRRCWYENDPDLYDEIIAAWKQFDIDLAAYVPPERVTVEKVIAEPVESFPAPVVTVTGTLVLRDNFKDFEARLRDFLDNKLIRQPKTDQDFVDLEEQIRKMKAGRESLKSSKAQTLAQVEAVDRAIKTTDMLDALLQQNCAMAERLLKDEKERRKGEIVQTGITRIRRHIQVLEERLGKAYMPAVSADFAGAIRGLKSLGSMEEKVDAELNRAKIAASQIADGIDANLKFLRENAADYKALFADTAQLVLKPADDFQALVRGRIAEHQATVQRQAEAAAEKAREAIRAEEQAKAEKDARAKMADEEAARIAALPVAVPVAQEALTPAPAPVANVVPILAARPTPVAPTAYPTLKLCEINTRIGPMLQTSAEGLRLLGFDVAVRSGTSCLYHESSYPLMLTAIVAHVQSLQAKQAA